MAFQSLPRTRRSVQYLLTKVQISNCKSTPHVFRFTSKVLLDHSKHLFPGAEITIDIDIDRSQVAFRKAKNSEPSWRISKPKKSNSTFSSKNLYELIGLGTWEIIKIRVGNKYYPGFYYGRIKGK